MPDLLWLTWRQHRWVVGGTSLAVFAYSALMFWSSVRLGDLAVAQCGGVCSGTWPGEAPLYRERKDAERMIEVVPVFTCLVALFWAAPLLSREYEQRTFLLAWSQDVSPLRWLAGKVVPLVLGAVVLALVLGAAAADLGDQVQRVRPESSSRFAPLNFEAFAPLQAGYALFGFALGLMLSVLVRRTVLAMGCTLAVFVATRMVIAEVARPYYQPPVRHVTSKDTWKLPPDVLPMASGYLDAAGNEVDPHACYLATPDSDSCTQGAPTVFFDHQPAERLTTFRLTETAIFGGLAGGLFVFAWLRFRRTSAG